MSHAYERQQQPPNNPLYVSTYLAYKADSDHLQCVASGALVFFRYFPAYLFPRSSCLKQSTDSPISGSAFPILLVILGPSSARSSTRLSSDHLSVVQPLGQIRLLSFGGIMEEADTATKALGLDEPPIGGPPTEVVDSETESEAEVTTMAVMAEPGNIVMGAESLPNSDETEAEFGGSQQQAIAVCRGLKTKQSMVLGNLALDECITT